MLTGVDFITQLKLLRKTQGRHLLAWGRGGQRKYCPPIANIQVSFETTNDPTGAMFFVMSAKEGDCQAGRWHAKFTCAPSLNGPGLSRSIARLSC